MGLFDRLEKNKSWESEAAPAYFEYESISDEAVTEIVKFYKRLVYRGYEFGRNVLNLKNRVWIHNEDRTIFFFQQGCNDKKNTDAKREEQYYCLLYKGEMWSVQCTKSYENSDAGELVELEVLYYPEKLGRESVNGTVVRNTALKALEFLQYSGGVNQYKKGLLEILGEESVNDLTELNEEWYEAVLGDEGMKGFVETQGNKKAQTDRPAYEFEVVTDIVYTSYFSNVGLKVKGPYCLSPKICVVNNSSNIRCFKPLPTEDLSGGVQEYENYIFVRGNDVFVAQAKYIAEMNTLLICKIYVSGLMGMEERQFLNNIAGGVAAIEELYRYNPMVECSEQLELVTDKSEITL